MVMHQNMPGVLDEARRYCDFLEKENCLEGLELHLKNGVFRNLQDRSKMAVLRESLIRDVEMRRPMSLVRLGDGEGNILFYGGRFRQYPQLSELTADMVWKLMFGRFKGGFENWSKMYSGIKEAISGATYLGVHTYEQVSGAFKNLRSADSRPIDIRGSVGVVAVWDWLWSQKENIGNEVTYVTCHVHKDILSFYTEIIRAAGNISLITCYEELLPKIQAQAGVVSDKDATYLIPGQAANIKKTPEKLHFPDRFNEIACDIDGEDLKGRLFFVGAGLAGKLYCEKIRRAGGMAIDVGSLMDVWMGLGVRPYQSKEFVDKNKL